MWNGGSEHVERLMREWLLREQTTLARQERIEAGLRELVQAPALDLRLRSALCEVQEGML